MSVRLSAVQPLAAHHQVAAFSCADPDIDLFLRDRARSEQALGLNQVHVATDGDDVVIGFFTLSPIVVRVEPSLLALLGTSSPPDPVIGGFLLGRLGVATSHQGRGIGEALVIRAAQLAKAEANIVGGAFMAVDPKSDRLVEWYERQDFVRLSLKSRRMILPFALVP